MKVGTGGYAYVVDAQGRLIAHPDISLVLQKTDLSALQQIRAAASAPTDESGPVHVVVGTDLKGHEVLSAFAPIAPLGWMVFVDLPIGEALAPPVCVCVADNRTGAGGPGYIRYCESGPCASDGPRSKSFRLVRRGWGQAIWISASR
jgi:hypothetical protein